MYQPCAEKRIRKVSSNKKREKEVATNLGDAILHEDLEKLELVGVGQGLCATGMAGSVQARVETRQATTNACGGLESRA